MRDQKTRTDRRIEALLRPRQTREDEEVSDDSEEDNRVRLRRAPSKRDQATQTDKSYSSFCCGFLFHWSVSGSFVVVLSSSVQYKWRQGDA